MMGRKCQNQQRIVQCRVCKKVLCRSRVLSKSPITLCSISTVKVLTQHGECVLLCGFCDNDLGKIKEEVICVSAEACELVKVEYDRAEDDYGREGKEVYVQVLGEIIGMYDKIKRQLEKVEDKMDGMAELVGRIEDFRSFMEVYEQMKGEK